MIEKSKYNRQIMWFGVDGQSRIEGVNIAIVGVGGTGSHVAQQLAYLGVKKFTLIDSDKISETNLHRLIGANDEDKGKLKVDVVKRLIISIDKETKVIAIPDTFISESGIAALKDSGFVFGCVDKDGARLLLTELCKTYNKPYLDVATEIKEGGWGGRIVFSDAEKGCLYCRKKLSQEEIRRDLSFPEERRINDEIYGVPKEKLTTSGPAVVSLNGTLSSLAVTEFLVHITDIRQARRNQEYHGMMGIVTNNLDKPEEGCYYCDRIAGVGDVVDMARYIRQGIDKILR